MDDLISRRAAIDLIHKIIYGFFDIVDDESEEPMSEKDKLLLEVNKAVSNGIKELLIPAENVIEIVWCKDCIYSQDKRACNLPYGMDGYCPLGKGYDNE